MTAIVVLAGDDVSKLGDGSLLDAVDVESLRVWTLGEDAQCVSLTCGDGTRAHGVACRVGSGRAVVVSRRAAFGTLREGLKAVTRDGMTVEEVKEAAKKVVDKALPRVEDDDAVGSALKRLTGGAIVTAWAAMLLEARIVLRARTKSNLAPLAAALVAGIEPLTFVHVYAPVLPNSDAVDVLSAPVPFIVGVSANDRRAWRLGTQLDIDAMFPKALTPTPHKKKKMPESPDDDSSSSEDDDDDDSDDDASAETFDESTRRDGVVIVDVDAGITKTPESLDLTSFATSRFWDKLSRRVGRRLRDQGPTSAIRTLKQATRDLLAARKKKVPGGPLDWNVVGGNDDLLLETDAEFDGAALWLYLRHSPEMPALWLPVEAMESVSPLNDRRIELAATEVDVPWFSALHSETDLRKRRRFVLAAPTPNDARTWSTTLEAAIYKARKQKLRSRPVGQDLTYLRDAVLRTQTARITLRRHFDEHPDLLAPSPPTDDDDDDVQNKRRSASEEMTTRLPSGDRARRRSFDDVLGGPRQLKEVFGRLLFPSRDLGDDDKKKPPHVVVVVKEEPETPQKRPRCQVLREAVDGIAAELFTPPAKMSSPFPEDRGSLAFSEQPQSPMLTPPVSIPKRRSRTEFDERPSLVSSDDDPYYRDVMLRRPRMLFPADDDSVVVSSNALNAAAFVAEKTVDEAALKRLVSLDDEDDVETFWSPRPTRTKVPVISPNDVVVALLDRIIALFRVQTTEEEAWSPRDKDGRNLRGDGDAIETFFAGVRATTGFEAFEEASALLWRTSLDTLAYDDDDASTPQMNTPLSLDTELKGLRSGNQRKKTFDGDDFDEEEDDDDEARRQAFWINLHNLSVVHACVARGAPPISQKSTSSGVVRYYSWSRSQKYAVGGAVVSTFQMEHSILRAPDDQSETWTNWIADLAHFGRTDPRRLLVPRTPAPKELSFALFAATSSSAPLTVFRATTKRGLQLELQAHAARALSRDLVVSSDNSPDSGRSDDRRTKVTVTLPAAMRWHRSWGRANTDILAAVNRLILDHCNDDRLKDLVDQPSPGKLKLEYQTYNWSPGLALA